MAEEKKELSQEDLLEIIQKQGKQIDKLIKVVGSKGTEITVAATEKTPKKPKETVKVGDEEYRWKAAVFILKDHGKVTAEEAATSDEIIKAILAIEGQDILVPVI